MSSVGRWARRCGVFALVWLLCGCSVPLVTDNQPLPMLPDGKPDFDGNYGLARYVKNVAANQPNAADDAGSDVLLFVTFSGGGKRSAAFGHGALRGLRDVPLHRPDGTTVNLLNALDYLSGVSGGSFPAAHYGLYRDKSFDTFRSDFLDVDINSYIWGIYLLPWHWGWLVNPLVGTNDYMAQVYDRLMFHGATYEDLAKVGRPIVSIDATDITNGATFPILGTNFGLLCSDLNSFPIARAVAASNGFPGLFSPITLRSYAEQCHGLKPSLAADSSVPVAETESAAARRTQLARLHDIYANPELTQYVHLMDGGIADNLALRALLNFFIVFEAEDQLFRQTALGTRRILVISVDGEAATPPALGQQRVVGGVFKIISAASGTQIDAYNYETLALAREQVRDLADRIRAARCAAGPVINGHPCEDVRGDLVHLSLSGIQDPAVRARLQAIPTGLTIPSKDVDALLGYGETLVRDNPVIRHVAAQADFPPRGPAIITGAPAGAKMATRGSARRGVLEPASVGGVMAP